MEEDRRYVEGVVREGRDSGHVVVKFDKQYTFKARGVPYSVRGFEIKKENVSPHMKGKNRVALPRTFVNRYLAEKGVGERATQNEKIDRIIREAFNDDEIKLESGD